jgi:S1/P1 Nuclease
MLKIVITLNFLICLAFPTVASAWNAEGHKVVGSVADNLLSAEAKQQVSQILGVDLRTAAPWLDCVKSVERQPDGTFVYKENPAFEAPCTPFATERARMEDYVRRNWFDCSYVDSRGVDRGCHNTYHFDDIAIQRDRFDRNFQGTNEHDLIAAINAAIAVLLDRPSPPPFSIKDKKEALFLLAHLIGDLHQPLHVSAVYLDKSTGNLVDPDITHTIDPATETIGGNAITDLGKNFHGEWDKIPSDLGDAATPELLTLARAQPADHGRIENWSVAWGSDTVLTAQRAFAGTSFAPNADHTKWTVTFADRDAYLRSQDALKRKQLAKGGARLAALLNTIWP